MASVSPSLDQSRDEWELALTRHRLLQLVPLLPYKTGRTWLTFEEQPFNGVFTFIINQVRGGRFANSLDVLLDILVQVMDETGWTVGTCPGSKDFASLGTYTTNPPESFERVCESLTWIVVIMECGISYHLMKSVDLPVQWDQADILRGFSIERALARIFSKTRTMSVLEMPSAGKLLRVLLRLTPPHLSQCVLKTPNMKIDHISTMTMPLCRICEQLLQCVSTLNPHVFGDLPDRAVKATFDPRSSKLNFDPMYRPLILSLDHFAYDDPARLLKAASYFYALKHDKHVEALAYMFSRCHNLFHVIRAAQNLPVSISRRGHLMLAMESLVEFHNNRTSSVDYSDVNLHLLITRGYLLGWQGDPWWKSSKKNAPPWRKYMSYYRGKIASSKTAEAHAAIRYFGHVAEHIYFVYCAGARDEQTAVLLEEFKELYPDAKLTNDRIMMDKMFPTGVSHAIMLGHMMFSTALPELWYHDNFSRPSAIAPPVMYVVLNSLSYRFNSDDPFLPTEFKTWGDDIVNAICYCMEQANEPGDFQTIYLESVCVGLLFLRTVSLDLSHLSDKVKLKLCHTLISCSANLTTRVRDYAMWTFVQLVTKFGGQALEPLLEIHQLVCSMLGEAHQGLLGSPLGEYDSSDWNLQYIYDLLRAKLYTTRKILKLDASKLVVNLVLESKTRAAVLVMLCSCDQSLGANSLLCMQLLVDEIAEWTNAKLPQEALMSESLYDQSLLQWIVRHAKLYLGHGFLMQTLTLKLSKAFPKPRVTALLSEFLKAVRRQWSVSFSNSSPKINSGHRKTMINLMILTGWIWPSISTCPLVHLDAPIPQGAPTASELVLDIINGIFSPQPHVRDACVVVTRSIVLPSPTYASISLQRMCELVLQKISNQQADEVLFSQLVLFNACIVRYISEASKMQTPSSFDVMAYHRKVLSFCQDYVFSEQQDTHTVEMFLSSLICNCSCSHSLLVCSKFEALEEIVGKMVSKIQHCPKTRHIKVLAQCLTLALADFSCYSGESYLQFDSRYATYKTIIFTLNHAIAVNLNNVEAVSALKKCLVNLNLANQEMAVIFFEDGATLDKPYLKEGLYESFEIALTEESLERGVRRDEEIVNALMQDSAIIHSVCEVCPLSEARDTIHYLSTIFCEYGRGYELAHWAFMQDFEAAQHPQELFRRNNFHVQILLSVANMTLKPEFFKALQKAVGLVFRDPTLFSEAGDETRGEQVVVELLDTCIQRTTEIFSPTFLRITRSIADKVNERFPGYLNTALRNLIFLRIICPVLVLPHNFGIVAHIPEGAVRDGLLLFAKYLQRLDADAEGSSPAQEEVRKLFDVLRKGPADSSLFVLDQPSSSHSVSMSFYGMHHFFYRHNRELQLQLQLHSGCAKPLFEDSNLAAQGTSAASFSQLLLRLGRPSVTLYDGSEDRRRSKRSSGRKHSVPAWLCQNVQRVKLVDVNGMPYIRLSAVFQQVDQPSVDLLAELNRRLETIASGPIKEFAVLVDCTWDKATANMNGGIHQVIQNHCKDKGLKLAQVWLLNPSFRYTQPSVQSASGLSLVSPHSIVRTLTSVDIDLDFANLLGLPEEGMLALRDVKNATRFDNITLGINGNEVAFTVYVGHQFVHVVHHLSNKSTCDTFPLSMVRLVNGAILLARRFGGEAFELRLALNDSTELHQKLWHVLNTTRLRYRGAGTVKPLLEVSVNKFYIYITCQCLLDIPTESLGRTAASLLPWILGKLRATNTVDLSPLVTSHSISRVESVSKEIGAAFPDLVTDLIISFIEITTKSGHLTHDSVRIVKPWFDQVFCDESQSEHFEVIVRNSLSMKIVLDSKMGTQATLSLLEQLGYTLMRMDEVAKRVLDIYTECALYRAQVLKDDIQNLVVSLPLSVVSIKYLMKLTAELACEEPDRQHRFKWSGLPRWPRLQFLLMLLCSAVWESKQQVVQVLPHIATIIVLFSSVGDMQLRRSMFGLLNKMIDLMAQSEQLSHGCKRLTTLKETLNSDRGKLVWGVQDSMVDEVWDEADVVQPESVVKIAEFVRDFLEASVGAVKFKNDSELIFSKMVKVNSAGCIGLRIRAVYGAMTFKRDGELLLPRPWQVGHFPMHLCHNLSHMVIIIKSHAFFIKRTINEVDDDTLGLQTWFGLLWLLGGYKPLFGAGLEVVRSCAQHLSVRAGKRDIQFSKLLEATKPSEWANWWRGHSAHPMDLPERGPTFGGVIVNMLLPALMDNATAQSAVETCESLLRAGDQDPGFGSQVCLALVLYVFDPKNRAFDELKSYGVLHEVSFDERELSRSLQHKLAHEMVIDPEAGTFSVVAVCSILLKRGSVAASGRFLNVVCQLPNHILQDVQPLIWPLCERIFHLLETDQTKDSIGWYERLLEASETRTEPLGSSLARLNQAAKRYGLADMVNEKFQIAYESRTMLQEFDGSIKEMFQGLTCMIQGLPYDNASVAGTQSLPPTI